MLVDWIFNLLDRVAASIRAANRWTNVIGKRSSILLAFLVLSLGFAGFAAAQVETVAEGSIEAVATARIAGAILDADGQPASGYRLVFRVPGTEEVAVTAPASADGAYEAHLPTSGPWAPVAVISPWGHRLDLPTAPGQVPEAGQVRNVTLDRVLVPRAREAHPETAGIDRLFLAFVEDVPRLQGRRWETQLDVADLGAAGDALVSRLIASYHMRALPEVEFGARLGLGGLDRPSGRADANGMTDTDLWARLHLPGPHGGRTEYAVGALVTLPTGETAPGLGFDAQRSKVFASMRRYLARGELSAHVGVRFNEDGELDRIRLDGQVAAAVGLAALIPIRSSWVAVVEAEYEGKRFSGGSADSQILAGVNWRLRPHVVLRGGLAFGLEDGAPDSRLLIGFAADF